MCTLSLHVLINHGQTRNTVARFEPNVDGNIQPWWYSLAISHKNKKTLQGPWESLHRVLMLHYYNQFGSEEMSSPYTTFHLLSTHEIISLGCTLVPWAGHQAGHSMLPLNMRQCSRFIYAFFGSYICLCMSIMILRKFWLIFSSISYMIYASRSRGRVIFCRTVIVGLFGSQVLVHYKPQTVTLFKLPLLSEFIDGSCCRASYSVIGILSQSLQSKEGFIYLLSNLSCPS